MNEHLDCLNQICRKTLVARLAPIMLEHWWALKPEAIADRTYALADALIDRSGPFYKLKRDDSEEVKP